MATNTTKPKKSDNKIEAPVGQNTYNGPLLTQTGSNNNNQTSFGGMNAQARPPVTIGVNGQMVTGQTANIPGTGNSGYTGNTGTTNAGNTQNGLSGVSAVTQANLNQYGAYKPSEQVAAAQAQLDKYGNGYQAGEGVTAAQAQLNQILGQQPGNYVGRYDDQIQGLITGLTDGSRKFDYNFNDDELFKYYSDLYTQQGKQAAQDVMGQAAAMTGGYGNSYAESAANQAYQQYLGQLYDRGMEMRDRAYQQYQDERQDEYNRLNMLQQADELGYGRYRDTVGDWRYDRDYYTGRLDQMSEQDYQRWMADRDYLTNRADRLSDQEWQRWMADRDFWTNMAQLENSDYWTRLKYEQDGQQFAEQMGLNWASLNQDQQQFLMGLAQDQSQFDATLAYNYQNMNQSNAWAYIQALIANGQMPSAELLAMAGLSAQDVQNMIAAAPASGGGGGGPSGSSNNNNNNNQNTSSWLNNMFVNGMNNAVDTLNSGLNSIGWFNFLSQMANGDDPTKPGIK